MIAHHLIDSRLRAYPLPDDMRWWEADGRIVFPISPSGFMAYLTMGDSTFGIILPEDISESDLDAAVAKNVLAYHAAVN